MLISKPNGKRIVHLAD